MNEKLQYASMLEIPVTTCNIVRKQPKPTRKRGKKVNNPEEVKDQLLQKVNSTNFEEQEAIREEDKNYYTQTISSEPSSSAEVQSDELNTEYQTAQSQEDFSMSEQQSSANITRGKIKKERKPFKLTVISVQLMIIGLLIASIFVTNALYPNGGLTSFFKGVFQMENTTVEDNRLYSDFAPVINCGGSSAFTLEDGVINFSGEGSVYSPCNGKVLEVAQNEKGKFDIKVEHNANFVSVFSGLDYAYCKAGDQVFGTLPVGYILDGSAQMCFTDSVGEIISQYQVVDNAVVWAV